MERQHGDDSNSRLFYHNVDCCTGIINMKKITAIILALFLFFAFPLGALAASGDTIVYITRTGECYHRDGCSYLKSRIEVTLQYAVDHGYRACSRCNPPRLDSPTRAAPASTPTPTPKPTLKPFVSNTPIAKPTINPNPAPRATKAPAKTSASASGGSPGWVVAGVAVVAYGLGKIRRKK